MEIYTIYKRKQPGKMWCCSFIQKTIVRAAQNRPVRFGISFRILLMQMRWLLGLADSRLKVTKILLLKTGLATRC